MEAIGIKFKKIHNIMGNVFNKEVQKLELTRSQMEVMVYLIKSKDKYISGKDIENFFDLTNPTVSGILNRLETKGFITRETSKTDARTKYIKVTEKAINAKKGSMKVINDIKKKMFEGVTEKEILILNRIVEKMINNISVSEEKKNV